VSAPDQNAYQNWWKNVVGVAVPWLAGGTNGQAEGGAWPAFLDYLIGQLIAARYVAYPDRTPSDALSHLGGDRLLTQGPSESEANFRLRTKTAWGNSPITLPSAQTGLPAVQSGGPSSGWALAGTWLQLLEELYWGGFTDVYIVQQNGYAFNLSGAPVVAADNSALLVRTPCSSLSVSLTSSVTPPTTSTTGRAIPAGNVWWQFAESRSANSRPSDTDYCNRFALFFPGSLPSQFMTVGTATFTASDTATVTWNNAFPTTSYHVQVGIPTIDSGGPVSVVADLTSLTLTGCALLASGAFTGSVSVLAWQDGANPYADLHPADLSRLQSLIGTWRPNALCVGAYVLVQGSMYGWPVATFSGRPAMGPSSIVRFEGVSGGI
jgi:hypothetical protein